MNQIEQVNVTEMSKPRVRSLPKKPIANPVSSEVLYYNAKKTYDKDTFILFALLYLTSCRITEALLMRKKDFKYEIRDGVETYIIRSFNLKNRRRKFKYLPIVNHKKDSKFFMPIKEFIGPLTDEDMLFPHITRNTACMRLRRATVITSAVAHMSYLPRIEKHINCHYLRHCRLTHLPEIYGMSVLQLTSIAGWSDPKLAMVYVHVDQSKVIDMMIKKR